MPRRCLQKILPAPATLRSAGRCGPLASASPIRSCGRCTGGRHLRLRRGPGDLLHAAAGAPAARRLVAVAWRINLPVIYGTTCCSQSLHLVPRLLRRLPRGRGDAAAVPPHHFASSPSWDWLRYGLRPCGSRSCWVPGVRRRRAGCSAGWRSSSSGAGRSSAATAHGARPRRPDRERRARALGARRASVPRSSS